MAFVARLLSKAGFNPDGIAVAAQQRLDTYGETIVKPLGSEKTAYAEEGSYYVVTNPTIGTGVKLQGDTTTQWVATTPSILIVNTDTVKSILVDYAKLLVTVAGAGLAQLQVAVLIDPVNRFSTGGTALTPVNVNTLVASGSIAKFYYGATATAASTGVHIIGRDVLRGAIPVANDVYAIDFGGDIAGTAVSDGTTTIMRKTSALPPVVIGPGHSLLLYLYAGSMSTSPSMEFEIGWIER